jgi:hypothetical protein
VHGYVEVDTLRERVESGRWTDMYADEFEVGAALELAVTLLDWRAREQPPAVLSLAEAWGGHSEAVCEAARALEGQESDEPMYGAPDREFWPLGTRPDLERAGALVLDRFRRRLRDGMGLPAKVAMALSKAAFELADNAIQHSGADENAPAGGAFGFQVEGRKIAFAVADRGRGVLASLRTNPLWSHLGSSAEALSSAVRLQASRRQRGKGYGFQDLLVALADLSGVLRFGSSEAVLLCNGHGAAREWRNRKRRPLAGFHASFTIEIQ